MNLLLNILLQAAPAAVEAPKSFFEQYSFPLMMVVLVFIFYFFMMRPQQKRQKEMQKAREAMKAGDKVVTAGGIHGRIKEVTDSTVLIEVADGVRIRVEKASVHTAPEEVQK